MTAIATISERFNLREVVKLTLPKEHGSWSLALEPLALGILVAPSAAGGALLFTAVAGFFLRRPLKLVFSGKPDPRIPLASSVVITLVTLAIAGLFLVAASGGIKNLWLLIPSAVTGIGFAWFDSRNEGREGAAELCGSIAFGILPFAFAKLAGWSALGSVALGLVMLIRSVPTVLFVRTYLRRNKGYKAGRLPAFIASLSGLFLTAWLVFAHLAPWPAVVIAVFLATRTIWFLGGNRRFSAKRVGIAELAFGIVMVLTLALTWNSH
jgi:hypothetical protein